MTQKKLFIMVAASAVCIAQLDAMSDSNWRKRKRAEMEEARERENIKRAKIAAEDDAMTDDAFAKVQSSRDLSKPKTAEDQMQELVTHLERYKGTEFCQKRKEIIMLTHKQHGIDPNALSYRAHVENLPTQMNAATDAAYHSDYDFMQLLLERNVNPNILGPLDSPLLFSVTNAKIAQLLIAHRADTSVVDHMGEPLAMQTPFKDRDPELIQLYGAQGQASKDSSHPGGSPLTRLVLQTDSYETKNLDLLLKKARLLVFAGVDCGARVTDGQYKGQNYKEMIAASIKEAQVKKEMSSHKDRYDRTIHKFEQLDITIQAAIKEREAEKQQALQREFPHGLAALIGQYAAE